MVAITYPHSTNSCGKYPRGMRRRDEMKSSGGQSPKSAELVRDLLHGSVSVLTTVGKILYIKPKKNI